MTKCSGRKYFSYSHDNAQRLLNRVFAVITFAMLAVGRSMALIPDYSKAQKAALRIIKLNKRESEIDPHDETGIVLVRCFL